MNGQTDGLSPTTRRETEQEMEQGLVDYSRQKFYRTDPKDLPECLNKLESELDGAYNR